MYKASLKQDYASINLHEATNALHATTKYNAAEVTDTSNGRKYIAACIQYVAACIKYDAAEVLN